MNDKVDINCIFVHWKNAKSSKKVDLYLFERFFVLFIWLICFICVELKLCIVAKLRAQF